MSDHPKPKPAAQVPSFAELRQQPARPPAPELAQEEKTAQMSPELLKRALAQSAAPTAPPPPPPPTRRAPPPPGIRPAPPPPPGLKQRAAPPPPGGPKTELELRPLAHRLSAPRADDSTEVTAPGSPLPRPATDKLPSFTPDAVDAQRAAGTRASPQVQVAARARPDPSLQQTQLSAGHQGLELPDPEPGPVTQLELDAQAGPTHEQPRQVSVVTRPHRDGPLPAGPTREQPRPRTDSSSELPEPPTRNERPARTSSPRELAVSIDDGALAAPQQAKGTAPAGSTEPVEVIAHPAGLPRRVLALLVDGLLLAGLDGALGLLVLVAGKAPPLPEGLALLDRLAMRAHDSGRLLAAAAVVAVGLAISYATLFAVALSGRTPGRLLAGVRLVDRRGGPPGAARALLRGLLAVFSFLFFGAGFWLWLVDRKGQALHDKLCSTFVVRLGPQRT